MKLLSTKTLAVLAVLGFVGYEAAQSVTSKVGYRFHNFKLLDFWKNLAKFKVVCQTTFVVGNYNSFDIDVVSFNGNLTYKKAQVTGINIPKAVTLVPNQEKELTFKFETKLLKAAAGLFLAFTDEVGIYEGAKVSGTAKVKLYGLTFGVPVSEDVTLSI